MQARESGYVFGGVATASWASTGGHKADAGAFLFSLTNAYGAAVRLTAKTTGTRYAVFHSDTRMCHFGSSDIGGLVDGCDASACARANRGMYAVDAASAPHAARMSDIVNDDFLLAGSRYYTPAEIETYALTF